MSQKKTGVLLSYVIMGVNTVAGLLFTPFMLRCIGDSQYGIYSVSTSLISFITLLDLGLGQTLVRYISKARALDQHDEEAKLNGLFLTLYSVIAVFAALAGAVLIFVYPLISEKAMTAEELELFGIVFPILMINTVLSFPLCVFTATITAYEKFIFLKAVNLTTIVLRYLTLILLLINGKKIVAVTITIAATSIAMQVICALYCVGKLKIRFRFGGWDRKLMKEIFWFSFFIFLNLIIDFLYSNTDKLILGSLCGTEAVTVYSFGVYFQAYFQELSVSMSGVFMPKVVGMVEKENYRKDISDLFNRVGRLQMLLLALALGGYIAVGSDFIRLWIGAGYSDAYYIGMIIMIPAIVPLTQNIGISVVRALNIHKYRSYMYLAIALINIGISIPLAMLYGGIGSAIGTCIACCLGQIIFMNWFYKEKVGIDIKQYWRSLGGFILISAPTVCLTFAAKMFFAIDGWLSFFAYAAVYTVLYGVLYWLFIANSYEKELFTGLFGKALRKK